MKNLVIFSRVGPHSAGGCFGAPTAAMLVMLTGLWCLRAPITAQDTNPATAAQPSRAPDRADEARDAGGAADHVGSADREVVAALRRTIVDVARRVESSVVAVTRVASEDRLAAERNVLPFAFDRGAARPTDPDYVPRHYGAGVVVGPGGLPGGVIVTTSHVVGNVEQSEYVVWSQHRPFPAKVLATAPWLDLAVLSIDADDLPPIPLGDASTARRGQIAIALGNPAGIARDGQASVSWGLISNLQRPAPPIETRSADPAGRETLHHFGTLIQTDAAWDAGFSGGALLDLDGRLIGLLTAYSAQVEDQRPAGLAIPVDATFRRALNSMREGKTPEFGFLGVGPQTLSAELRRRGEFGARVVSVVPGAPADRADVLVGDVLTHVDGQPVWSDADLFRMVGELPPEAEIRVALRRGRASDTVPAVLEKTIVLSKRFTNTRRAAVVTATPQKWRGLVVDYATAAPEFSRPDSHAPADSVYVAHVEVDSPAWRAGLRQGDFILRVGGRIVRSPQAFADLVANRSGQVTVSVHDNDADGVARTISP